MNAKFLSFPPISPNLDKSKKSKVKNEISSKPKKICQTPKGTRKDLKTDIVIKITSPIKNKKIPIEKDSAIMTNYSKENIYRNSNGRNYHFSSLSKEEVNLENNIDISCKRISNSNNLSSRNNRVIEKSFNNNTSFSTNSEERTLVNRDFSKVSSNKYLHDCDNQNLMRSSRLNGNLYHQQQFGNVFSSLSSPESAYSTGYSTDGTSPGKYYI